MDGHPERDRLIEALIDATARDPFRARGDVLGEVARVTGRSLDDVQSLLPLPGTVEWAQDTGPHRITQGGGLALDDVVATVDLDEISGDLDSSEPKRRRSAVDRLMIGAESSAEATALVLRALEDSAPDVRLAAIPGSWRFTADDIPARLRKLADTDPDTDVRTAAITRLGLNGDRDPENVKALMPMVDSDLPVDVRTAAVTALGRCGRGYARVPSVVRTRLSWAPEAAVRSAALGTSCLLTTTAEAEDFVRHAVPVLSRHPGLAVEHQSALQSLADRVPAVVAAAAASALDEDRNARRACAHLVGAMASPVDVERARLLVQLADDLDADVRSAAMGAAAGALARARGTTHREVAALLESAAGA